MDLKGRSSKPSRATLIATRLCLILSLWQAPIPWLHCHGTDVSEARSSEATGNGLSTHLAVFHPATDLNSDHDFGWHLHWVLPCWGHALDDTPDDEPPSQEVVAFDQATVSPTHSISHRGPMVIALDLRLPRQSTCADRLSPILASSLNPISRRDNFSVLRC